MKIILAGAGGYLGGYLLKELLKTNHDLLCLYGKTPLSHQNTEKATFISSYDPAYEKTVSEFRAETVINAVGVYDRLNTPVYKLTEGNVIFPLGLLNITMQNGLKRWINSCTSLPQYLDTYTMSKYQLADWGKIYASRHDITFVNVLLEHFYGPGDKEVKFISFLLDKLRKNESIRLTSGRQRRDFIFIEDVVKGYLTLLDAPIEGYIDVPMGSGEDPKVREVVEFLKEHTHSSSELLWGEIPLRKDEPMTSVADLTILESLGFTPEYDWQTGMQKTISEVVKK